MKEALCRLTAVAWLAVLCFLASSCEKSGGGGGGGEDTNTTSTTTTTIASSGNSGGGGTSAPRIPQITTTIPSTPVVERPAGVLPQVGNYSFSVPGSSFSVGGGAERFVSFAPQNYTDYSMKVNDDGSFHFQNGYVGSNHDSNSGNLYPTDGFVIDGQFYSSTEAAGTVSYVYNGEITATFHFTASAK